MSQGQTVLPTTGTVSGLSMTQDTNAALNALLTDNSGSSAPTNTLSGTPEKGQTWLDTSVTPNALRKYDGSNWNVVGYFDAVNSIWIPPVGGGQAAVASASTTDIFATPASSISVSGTSTITQFASADAVPGTMKLVTATGAFTMTHDATKLILPTGQPVTVAVGDSFWVLALAGGTNVRVLGYSKADGTSLQVSNRYLGELIPITTTTPPPLTVLPFGQTLSRTTYAALWAQAQIEITAGNAFYNVGNGSTTFGIGDMRGYVIAAPDDMGGSAASRLTGFSNGTVGGTATHTLTSAEIPAVTFSATTGNDSPDHTHVISVAAFGTVASGSPTITAPSTGSGGSNLPVSSGASTRHQHAVSGAINGSGGAHTIVQPTRACNVALYAGA